MPRPARPLAMLFCSLITSATPPGDHASPAAYFHCRLHCHCAMRSYSAMLRRHDDTAARVIFFLPARHTPRSVFAATLYCLRLMMRRLTIKAEYPALSSTSFFFEGSTYINSCRPTPERCCRAAHALPPLSRSFAYSASPRHSSAERRRRPRQVAQAGREEQQRLKVRKRQTSRKRTQERVIRRDVPAI